MGIAADGGSGHDSGRRSFYSPGDRCFFSPGEYAGFSVDHEFFGCANILWAGALFPLEGLPKAIAVITGIESMSYSVDALRALLINTAHLGFALDLAVLGVGALVFLSGGSYLFSKSRSQRGHGSREGFSRIGSLGVFHPMAVLPIG